MVCLWEANNVEDVQHYADETMGDSSSNLAFGIAAEQSFSQQPLGIAERSALVA